MRCKNCGWTNEDGASRCIKCNATLHESTNNSTSQSANYTKNGDNLRQTLRESSTGIEFTSSDDSIRRCAGCGYPLGNGTRVCPVCQTPVNCEDSPKSEPEKKHNPSSGTYGGTVNPWATPMTGSFCTLKRIPWQNEQVQYDSISYSGHQIVLNRANTDERNNSITSKTQAILTRENGEWFIENRSDLQTTFIRVDRKIKLQDGDTIVLGNRMFEFRKG